MAFPNWKIYLPDQWYRPLLHAFGISKDNLTPMGHSLIVIVNGTSGEIVYTDFGRYCVPPGLSRARLYTEDPLLKVPLKANVVNGKIENLQAIMEWVADAKFIHYSGGPLFYKPIPNTSFAKGLAFAKKMAKKGFLHYNIFGKENSNCSRYVRDVIMQSLQPKNVDWGYKYTVLTPTPIDNVFFHERDKGYWTFEDGKHTNHKHGFFDHIRFYNGKRKIKTVKKEIKKIDGLTWVPCNGVGSYFNYNITDNHIEISKYSIEGVFEWTRQFKADTQLNPSIEYTLDYGTHLQSFFFKHEDQSILVERDYS